MHSRPQKKQLTSIKKQITEVIFSLLKAQKKATISSYR